MANHPNRSTAHYEILRSDGTIVSIPHATGSAAAWAECKRVAGGAYAVHMDFVAANGRRVECMDFPAAH